MPEKDIKNKNLTLNKKPALPHVLLYHPNNKDFIVTKKHPVLKEAEALDLDPLYIINLKKISEKNKILEIIDKKVSEVNFSLLNGVNDFDEFIKKCDAQAGMFFSSTPKNTENFESDIKQIMDHHNAISDIHQILVPSYFYTSALNSINYGISIINKKYQILYTNKMRRYFHGKNIIGKFCYNVFPDDGDTREKSCPFCPMKYQIFSKSSNKHYRCEVHKLSASEHENEVYFATESASRLNINIPHSEIELGLNVVKDNTSRILFQEFTKLIQRAKGYSTIIEILKFALLGGLKKDFETNLKNEFEDDEKTFDEVLEKVTYYVGNEGRILNFKIGRFRFYRNHNDTFKNPNLDGDTLQIFKAFKIDRLNNPLEETDLIWKTIDYSKTNAFDNVLKFDSSGKISKTSTNFDKNIPKEKKKELINYLKHFGLLEENETDIDKDKHLWYDIKLNFDNKLFGYISFDWKGREKEIEKSNITDEHLRYLKMLIDFSAQAIQRTITHKISHTLAELNKKIGQHYNNESEMLYKFAEQLVKELKVLRFELFIKEKGNVVRKFVHYNGLRPDENRLIYNRVESYNVYDIKKGLIGAALEKIEAHKKKENEWIPINVLSYKLYDKHFASQPEKKIRQEFLTMEYAYFPDNYEFKNIEIQNCIVAPLVLRGSLIGVIKLSNNLNTGKAYFPKYNKAILHEVANQLAIRMEIFRAIEREKRIDKIFTSLSELLALTAKPEEYQNIDKDLKSTNKRIIKNVIVPLKETVNYDNAYYFKINKDFNKEQYKIKEIHPEFQEDLVSIEYFYENLNEIIKNYPNFELEFNLTSRIARKHAIPYFSPDNKSIWLLYFVNNEPFSIMILLNHYCFSNDDFHIIRAMYHQTNTLLNLNFLLKKTEEIMENVAHQVISPLTGLSKHCDNLMNGLLHPDHVNYFINYQNVGKRKYVYELLKSQTSHVRSIVERYKHFIDFDLGIPLELSPKIFDLKDTIIKFAAIYQPYAKEQGIDHISVSNLSNLYYMRMYGDSTVLLHILSSLIDNAIKYSDKGKKISLLINYDKEELKYFIEIVNYGITIPEKYWEEIFERNFRTRNAAKRNVQGSGIGLYLVKRLSDEIGGNCIVKESNKKNGTIFLIELPKTLKRK